MAASSSMNKVILEDLLSRGARVSSGPEVSIGVRVRIGVRVQTNHFSCPAGQ